jgi:hypothetical protein
MFHISHRTSIAIALGIVIPSTVIIIILLVICIRRRQDSQPIRGYLKVGDEFDEEEIEFKRMIESKNKDEDYEDLFSSESMEDFFDEKDKDHLSMLENLRSNLVKGANFSKNDEVESGSESEADKMRL